MHSWHYEWGFRSTLTMVSGFTKSQREFRWRIWQERQAFETMEGTSTSCSLFLPSFFKTKHIMCIYIYVWIIPILYIRSIDLQLSMVFCLRLGSRRWICCGLVPYRCRFCGFDAETMWFFITQNQPFYLEDPMSFPKWNCLKPVHNIYIYTYIIYIYKRMYIYGFDAPRVNIKMFRSIFELSTSINSNFMRTQ